MANESGGGGGGRRSPAKQIADYNANPEYGIRQNANPRRSSGSSRSGSRRSGEKANTDLLDKIGQLFGGGGNGFSFNPRGIGQGVGTRAQKELDRRAQLAGDYAKIQQQFLDQFGVDLPPLQLLTAPNKQAYVGPFDQAKTQANKVYGETVPVLNNIYNDLGGELTARQAEARTMADKDRAAAAAEQATLQQQARAITAPTGLAQQLGVAGPGSQAAEVAAADQAYMKTREADTARLNAELAAMEQQQSAARGQDAEAMRSGSLATARTNLDTILQSIGLGRAQAEREYAADAANVSNQNNQLRQQYAAAQQDAQMKQLEMAAQAEQMWADQNERYAKASLTSGRQQFEAQLDSRMASSPAKVQAVLDIIDAAGTGPTGRASALRILQENGDLLARGKVVDPETGEASYGGKRLDVASIRKWLDEFYDEQEYVDPRTYGQYGGDPTYLAVRDTYAR